MPQKTIAGFTLIEATIVLVVIGFIIAAIVKGGSVMKSAKLRSIISQVEEYKVSVNSFKAAYGQLPGDFDDASAYWSSGTIVDGDNNGQIEFQNSSDDYEGYNAWQHLSNARMVELPFVGTETTGVAVINTDIPEAIKGGGYFFHFDSANVISLGNPTTPNTVDDPDTIRINGSITGFEAHEIDSKTDDSLPTTGMTRSADGNDASAGDCVETPANIYNVSSVDIGCYISFTMTQQ